MLTAREKVIVKWDYYWDTISGKVYWLTIQILKISSWSYMTMMIKHCIYKTSTWSIDYTTLQINSLVPEKRNSSALANQWSYVFLALTHWDVLELGM